MNRAIKCFLLLSLFTITTAAQDKLVKLKPQTSPAASILGLDAVKLITPKSEQALIASIYSNFLSGSSQQGDFSLEFSPYWMSDHGLSFSEFIGPADLFNGQFIRNSSFSIAVTQKFLLGDSTNSTGIGIGYRTSVHFAPENELKKLNLIESILDSADVIRREIAAKIIRLYDEASGYDDFLKKLLPEIRSVINKKIKEKEVSDSLGKKIEEMLKGIAEYPKGENEYLGAVDNKLFLLLGTQDLFESLKKKIAEREGLTIDLAASLFVNFPANNFEFSYSPKQAIWILPSYRFTGGMNFLNVMGVLRYESCNMEYYRRYFPKAEYFNNNLDYGISIAAEFSNFIISIELTGRTGKSEIPAGTDNLGNPLYRKETGSDFQYIGQIGYRINDQIMINYNLGKKFKPEINPGNTLVSLLSLNFGFGAPETKKPVPSGKQ